MTPSGWLHPGRIPDRLVDLLEVDGGWLTAEGIAADLRANPETVHRALFRLRKRNWVRSRYRNDRHEWCLL